MKTDQGEKSEKSVRANVRMLKLKSKNEKLKIKHEKRR